MKIDLEKLAKEVVGKMKTAGARDHSLYVNTLLKIQQQLESQSEGKWWQELRDLKETFEGIEEFKLDKSIFEKAEKKKLFLMI